ncbi:MAG TPA: hypothetical protein VGM80_16085 [Gaiellaceae bacterium]
MTGRNLRLSLVLAALVAALSASAASAGPIRPGTLPVTMTLPSGWASSAPANGARFDASAPSGYGRLEITTGGSFPEALPFSEFVKTETSSARSAYRHEDPKAVVSGRKLSFASGPVVEITATVHHGTPLSIVIYSFLHGGVTYHFTYFTYTTSIHALRGAFLASAKSVHFTK